MSCDGCTPELIALIEAELNYKLSCYFRMLGEEHRALAEPKCKSLLNSLIDKGWRRHDGR